MKRTKDSSGWNRLLINPERHLGKNDCHNARSVDLYHEVAHHYFANGNKLSLLRIHLLEDRYVSIIALDNVQKSVQLEINLTDP